MIFQIINASTASTDHNLFQHTSIATVESDAGSTSATFVSEDDFNSTVPVGSSSFDVLAHIKRLEEFIKSLSWSQSSKLLKKRLCSCAKTLGQIINVNLYHYKKAITATQKMDSSTI